MKIGITCHTGSGGSGVLATELGLRLAARGHEVHFITREAPFRLRGFVENVFLHLVETVYYPLFQEPPHTLSLASKMAEACIEGASARQDDLRNEAEGADVDEQAAAEVQKTVVIEKAAEASAETDAPAEA